MTAGGKLHSIGFMIAFGALIVSCFVFALHFLNDQQILWAAASFIAGLGLPALVGLGISTTMAPGVAFCWAVMLAWLWLGITVLLLPQTS